MFNWYKKVVFENYVNFNGRARRSEYWWFTLMNTLIVILATILDSTLGLNFEPLPYGYIYFLYLLAIILPSLAVAVRRLHDVGKSGWFYFIVLIPLIGAIWLLVLFCTEGDSGENEYGADPKNDGNEIHDIGNNEA
jgi:uncharacterized membrane protein YhaH (DUF805 family)